MNATVTATTLAKPEGEEVPINTERGEAIRIKSERGHSCPQQPPMLTSTSGSISPAGLAGLAADKNVRAPIGVPGGDSALQGLEPNCGPGRRLAWQLRVGAGVLALIAVACSGYFWWRW